ncbi:TonB family protein [Pelagerythrobacter aerophilus]|uniref:TonB family protein n=2 Tax=Pelagerythrobacter aerophilus TaxID=2306995 RepID=A0A418NFF6_9SPHN|nr:TonB family protein [Pelagerythrobacter aerophilus]
MADDVPWARGGRYCDQPTNWRTRLFGLVGTALIAALVLAGALVTWPMVTPPSVTQSSPPLIVVDLQPMASPPEPVREVAPGPEQVERQEKKPEPAPDTLMLPPLVQLPRPSIPSAPPRPPVEIVDPGPVVPETTAPRRITAPAASQVSNNAKPDWEALLLAHLEQFRRYPARARAARQEGTAYIRFTMNRAGEVLSATVARKSGHYALDQAALDTLRRAQPLPAIPKDKPDVLELTIPVEFYLR